MITTQIPLDIVGVIIDGLLEESRLHHQIAEFERNADNLDAWSTEHSYSNDLLCAAVRLAGLRDRAQQGCEVTLSAA